MTTDYDVIVVGAGAAGLAATQTLVSAGLSVICIEASDRIGGRTHTDTNIFGVPFDMGAHWLHAEHANALKAPGIALGLDLYPAPDNGMTYGLDDDAVLWDEVDEIQASVTKQAQVDRETEKNSGTPTDRSLADIFVNKGPWSFTAAMTFALSLARDLPDTSLRDMAAWEGGDDWFCREGFGHLVARTATGLPIKLSTPVTDIEAKADGIQVTTTAGKTYAQAVIVTASVGVLAEDVIRFDPPLDAERRSAFELITMGDYNHAGLLFQPGTLPVPSDTWLTYHLEPDGHGVARGGGFLCNVSGTGLTSFESSGSFSRDLQELGADSAIEHALETLTGFFGTSVKRNFIKGHATAWRKEPYVRGSYAGANPGGYSARTALRRPHTERVFFAGEASHESQQCSVSGAHLEGIRAASDVLAAHFQFPGIRIHNK
ncbi:flavin monoamine oxidase family protein [Falsiruegeria mediterranea]|uniref:Tryptophan 2-monooxygenase n=1 Tax=Falsiruegeria mediterranea M17 TaxID=1200281 RepID=A0A2R8CDW5_9RHOB|nr:NAD(P)/FAD-dependent oxidoreductase [Falsiruegeria mediterranea]SPJ30601.1 Pseudooxynicotine oxidase [Falsiruegeria mediterranea M17]